MVKSGVSDTRHHLFHPLPGDMLMASEHKVSTRSSFVSSLNARGFYKSNYKVVHLSLLSDRGEDLPVK